MKFFNLVRFKTSIIGRAKMKFIDLVRLKIGLTERNNLTQERTQHPVEPTLLQARQTPTPLALVRL